jgi:hypothetical protein
VEFMVRHTRNLTANHDKVVDQEFYGADHGTLSAAFTS